jgi:hypothetical protein
MTEPIYRRAAKDGDEVDAFANDPNGPVALDRAGIRHATKTRASRRYRRIERQHLRDAAHWGAEMLHAAGRADVDGIVQYYDLATV